MQRTFRQFVELKEVKPNYFDKLQDELDIDPEHIGPQWAANIDVNNIWYNGMTYNIEFKKNADGRIFGAILHPQQTQRTYTKKDDKYIRRPEPKNDKKPFFVSRQKLADLLNQGQTNSQAPSILPGMGI